MIQCPICQDLAEAGLPTLDELITPEGKAEFLRQLLAFDGDEDAHR